ncbi:hypothetical protein [Leptolyngbya sp. GGD]|uniref:hypothetical protein n=1 Tax=Leptolyngbya sp. GGD TaxID=2997907 RepID=UPI00227A01B1|nr:hypothetical protein [Leptolyngbya sp. GGD]MCY6494565.1 hypothetical protein [Leptolyngbya sp. GGD]
MEVDEAVLQFLRELLSGPENTELSKPQEIVFRAVWNGLKYKEIPSSGYSNGYLERTIGPQLWKRLSEKLGEGIQKRNMRVMLENAYLDYQQSNYLAPKQVLENIAFQSITVDSEDSDITVDSDAEPLPLPSDFCYARALFQQHYRETFEIYSLDPDTSDLNYIFINTKIFSHCKRRLIQEITKYRDEHSQTSVHNFVVWSLLGSAELLIAFRASREEAKNFCRILEDELSDCVDEPPDSGHAGIFMIGILNEFYPGLPINMSEVNRGNLSPAKRRYVKVFPYAEFRSEKAFIKLRFVGDGQINDRLLSRINESICDFHDVLEMVSICVDRRYIMLEVHMPCGHFFRLNQLSIALEPILNLSISKETYLGYDSDFHL